MSTIPLGGCRGTVYIGPMSTFFMIAAILAMIAVLATLGAGLVSMTKGGDFNARYGNRLMRWRVILQGVAVVLFVLALLTAA